MPKKIYEDVRMLKSKNKPNIFRLLYLLLFVCIMIGIVMISQACASMLSMKGLNWIWLGHRHNTVDEFVMYGVALGEFDNTGDAETRANAVVLLGAGAYVWEKNDKYYVVGAVYDNKEDAILIKDSIETKWQPMIIDIDFDAINVKNEELLLKYYKEIKNIYDKVYNISNKIDSGILTPVVAGNELNTLRANAKVILGNLQYDISNNVCDELILLNNCFINIEAILDGLIVRVLQGNELSYDVRNASIRIVFIWHNLHICL